MLLSACAGPESDGSAPADEWVTTHKVNRAGWISNCGRQGEAAESCAVVRDEEFLIGYISPSVPFNGIALFRATSEFAWFYVVSAPPPVFTEDGIHITRDGATVWRARDYGCGDGDTCMLDAEAADTLLELMAKGGTLRIEFKTGSQPQLVTWDLSSMAEVLEDYRNQAAARGLL